MPGLVRYYKKLRRVPNELQFYDLVRAGAASPELAITCRGKTDGAGAQANACISAMAVAAATGLRYRHTPFQFVEHAVGEQAAWTQAWEDFFGLGLGEEIIVPDAAAVGLKAFLDLPKREMRAVRLVHAQHYQAICNQDPDMYNAILPRLREKYAAQDKSSIPLDRAGEDVVVAVHIRRGDVSMSDPTTSGRFTNDDRIVATVRVLQDLLRAKGRSFRVNIYSEGRQEDFARFVELGCHLYVGKDAFETVHNLASSDILVAAKSAFSFVAGLISQGVKLYEPYQSVAPGDWVKLQTDGSFDRAKVMARI